MRNAIQTHPVIEAFGIDENLLTSTLAEAMSRGADFSDLYFQTSSSNSITLEDGLVSRAGSSVDRGVGIRAVIGDQTGYAYSEVLEPEAMKEAARTAAAIAAGKSRPGPQEINLGQHAAYYDIGRGWDLVGVKEKLPILRKVEALARAANDAVERVTVRWVDVSEQVLIVTSDGNAQVDDRPMVGMIVMVTARKGDERQTGSASRFQRDDINWFTEERIQDFVNEAVEKTMILFEAGKPPAGEMPVVLRAGASGILLHEAIGHGLEADFNRKGTSIYSDKVGERVASEHVTVVDDGTLEHERGALNIDDEGNATERTVLIENGILKGYMHDRISAKQYGVAPTGSGRRESFRHTPMPRMRCTYMESGPHSFEELVASVDRGIVCDTFTNGQVQIGAGDFTFFVKNGWLIEGGKMTRPIKNVNIIGNGPEALSRIDMVADDAEIDLGGWTCGKDGQGVPVSQGIPSVLVSSLVVGGQD